jgi:hypothetical protein
MSVSPNIEKRPTATQRKNIILVTRLMTDMLGTPEAKQYDHSTIQRCTVGVAVRSRRFREFNDNCRIDDRGVILAVDQPGIGDVSDTACVVFGRDYYDYIVFGGGSTGCMVYEEHDPENQLRYIIAYIKLRYGIKDSQLAAALPPTLTRTVEVDTTKAAIKAAFEKNVKLIEACNLLLDDTQIDAVARRHAELSRENEILQKYL